MTVNPSGLRRSARLASKTPNPKRSLLTQKIAIAKGKGKAPPPDRLGEKSRRAQPKANRERAVTKPPKRKAKSVLARRTQTASPLKRRGVEVLPNVASGSSALSSSEVTIEAEYIPRGTTYDLRDGTLCYIPPGQPDDTIMRRRYVPPKAVWTPWDYVRSAQAQVQPQPFDGVRRDSNPYVRGESVASQATDYIVNAEGWQSYNFMRETPPLP